MNLKEQMMNEYQNNDVKKTIDQITGDIKYQMKNGMRHSYQKKKVLTPKVIEELEIGGFKVEEFQDKTTPFEMMVIKW